MHVVLDNEQNSVVGLQIIAVVFNFFDWHVSAMLATASCTGDTVTATCVPLRRRWKLEGPT